ncbi:MAG: 30S ribosomal protein S3 [Patescibacteria group bacterium]|nr:30S ribosomal protein S3 [Patescibacteria group bacterium]
MGQKIDPRGLRIGINKTWNSRWYNKRNYKKLLQQDIMIGEYIKKRFKHASISSVETERSVAKIRIVIHTNSPGMLIGRGGKGLEDLRKDIERKFLFNEKLRTQIDVNEVRAIEENAQLLADDAAMQLEKRISFRRVMKTMISKVMYNRNVLGVKIQLSGRLGGAEMSRTEWLSQGSLPLHTLRANIDFAKAIAYTTYGTIGVKVWLNKKTAEDPDNS